MPSRNSNRFAPQPAFLSLNSDSVVVKPVCMKDILEYEKLKKKNKNVFSSSSSSPSLSIELNPLQQQNDVQDNAGSIANILMHKVRKEKLVDSIDSIREMKHESIKSMLSMRDESRGRGEHNKRIAALRHKIYKKLMTVYDVTSCNIVMKSLSAQLLLDLGDKIVNSDDDDYLTSVSASLLENSSVESTVYPYDSIILGNNPATAMCYDHDVNSSMVSVDSSMDSIDFDGMRRQLERGVRHIDDFQMSSKVNYVVGAKARKKTEKPSPTWNGKNRPLGTGFRASHPSSSSSSIATEGITFVDTKSSRDYFLDNATFFYLIEENGRILNQTLTRHPDFNDSLSLDVMPGMCLNEVQPPELETSNDDKTVNGTINDDDTAPDDVNAVGDMSAVDDMYAVDDANNNIQTSFLTAADVEGNDFISISIATTANDNAATVSSIEVTDNMGDGINSNGVDQNEIIADTADVNPTSSVAAPTQKEVVVLRRLVEMRHAVLPDSVVHPVGLTRALTASRNKTNYGTAIHICPIIIYKSAYANYAPMPMPMPTLSFIQTRLGRYRSGSSSPMKKSIRDGLVPFM